MLRSSIVDLFELLEETGLAQILIPIHDALLLQCLPADVEQVVERVRQVMEKDWSQLNGLSIKTSCKIGTKNWSEMEDYVAA